MVAMHAAGSLAPSTLGLGAMGAMSAAPGTTVSATVSTTGGTTGGVFGCGAGPAVGALGTLGGVGVNGVARGGVSAGLAGSMGAQTKTATPYIWPQQGASSVAGVAGVAIGGAGHAPLMMAPGMQSVAPLSNGYSQVSTTGHRAGTGVAGAGGAAIGTAWPGLA